jgi:methylthioribose-1-phosphate isomerase
MDGLIQEGIRQIASQQGAGWVLFLFASAFAFWLLLQLLKSKTVCAQQYAQATEAREQLQEKRVEEARQTAAALSAAANTLADIGESMKDRTNTLDSLVTLVKQTARDIEQNGLRWQDRVSAIDKTLNDISRCQVEILHRVSRTTP